MKFDILFRPSAGTDLESLYQFISQASGKSEANAFVSRIEAACLKLGDFPEQGKRGYDLGPGIRLLASVRRVTIA